MTENSYLAFVRRLIIQLVSAMATPLERQYSRLAATMENCYLTSHFARGSMVQHASAMAAFLLNSNVSARERGSWLVLSVQLLCASQTMSFAHGPIILTNQMCYDTLSEKYL